MPENTISHPSRNTNKTLNIKKNDKIIVRCESLPFIDYNKKIRTIIEFENATVLRCSESKKTIIVKINGIKNFFAFTKDHIYKPS